MNFDRRQLLAALPASAAAFATTRLQDPQGKAPDKPAATPKTRFAANIEMWWGGMPVLDKIRAAHTLGFPAIEFWPWRGKDVAAIAALTQELGMAVAQFTAWGFSPGLNQQKNHEAFVAEIEASCKIAKELRCPMMTVVGGNDVKGMTQVEMHDQIIAGLKLGAKVAEQHNVMLILEPMNIRVDHKGHCLYGSEAAVKICRAVGSPMVKINWDLYHCHISEGDLCGHLRDGFDQLGYAQLADHPGRTEPGTGEIHYPRVLKELHALGYRGYVGVECRPSKPEAEAAKGLWFADQWS
ncbi:MAG: TIM barrel protein [Planctomycetes bacterium]|nr:TIM barrel protein [Planctomycetota bacterium]